MNECVQSETLRQALRDTIHSYSDSHCLIAMNDHGRSYLCEQMTAYPTPLLSQHSWCLNLVCFVQYWLLILILSRRISTPHLWSSNSFKQIQKESSPWQPLKSISHGLVLPHGHRLTKGHRWPRTVRTWANWDAAATASPNTPSFSRRVQLCPWWVAAHGAIQDFQGQVGPQLHQEQGGDTRSCQEKEWGAEQCPGHCRRKRRRTGPFPSVHNKTLLGRWGKKRKREKKSQGPIRKSIVRGDDWLTPFGGPGARSYLDSNLFISCSNANTQYGIIFEVTVL